MKRSAPVPHLRAGLAFASLFAAGLVAAIATTSSSAAPADDCVLPISCPTLPTVTLPTISVPSLPLPTSSTTTTSTPPASPAPPAPSGSGSAAAVPAASFRYTVTRVAVRKTARARWIDVQLSLSQAATVVAVLHKRGVPSLVAIRGGKSGANRYALTVPARVKAGRYTFKLVFGLGTEHHTFTRPVSVPR